MSSELCLQNDPDSFCNTCVSLNYTKSYDLKPKEDVKTPFKLASIPIHLLTQIFEKMDMKSFTRMRYSCKEYSGFIDKNREKLRIALFHTKQIDTGLFHSGGPSIKFEYDYNFAKAHTTKYLDEESFPCYSCSFLPSTDFGQFENSVRTIAREFRTYGMSTDGRKVCEIQKSPSDLEISLREWAHNPVLRKELVGVYHNSHVELRDVLYELSSEDCNIISEFLKYAQISKVSYYSFNHNIFPEVMKHIKPSSMILEYNFPKDTKFLKQEAFENVKNLHIRGSDFEAFPEDLLKIETLVIHDYKSSQSAVLPLLEKWVSGSIPLREFCIATNFEISLQSLDVKPLWKSKSWKFCRRYMSFNKWSTAKRLRVYLLEQKKTKKKAVCIITDEFTRFRVISST